MQQAEFMQPSLSPLAEHSSASELLATFHLALALLAMCLSDKGANPVKQLKFVIASSFPSWGESIYDVLSQRRFYALVLC